MNRRKLLQMLGIGTLAAVAAPQAMADNASEIHPTSSKGDITLKMLQDAYSQTVRPDVMPVSLEGLSIYEQPKDGYDYSIGVDIGFGPYDPSCISVMRKGKEGEPDTQVA